jgi:hypothetical protein
MIFVGHCLTMTKKHCHIWWLLKRLPPFNGIQKQYLHGPKWWMKMIHLLDQKWFPSFWIATNIDQIKGKLRIKMLKESILGSSKRFNPKVQHTIVFTNGVMNFKALKKDTHFLPSVWNWLLEANKILIHHKKYTRWKRRGSYSGPTHSQRPKNGPKPNSIDCDALPSLGVNPLEGSPKCSCGKLGLGRRSRLPTLERGGGSSWEPMD